MNKYELLAMYSASLTEEEFAATIAKYSGIIEGNGGKILTVDKWGVKKLAYPINFKKEANYVLYMFESDATVPAKITRAENIDDAVYRSLCLNKQA